MPRIPFANIPENLMSCMFQTENYIKSLNVIDESFMSLLRYRVSVINHCAYCIEMHFKEAVAAGESELRIYSSPVWRETNYYTESEQALLSWAESVTQLQHSSSQTQKLYETLNKYLSQEDIANFTLAIIQINAWNRIAKSFGFESGQYKAGQHS